MANPVVLAPGDQAPPLALTAAFPGGERVPLEIRELAGRQRQGVIVFFYPRAMTPGCTRAACDFRDDLSAFTAAGWALLGVSPDPLSRLETFLTRDHLTFPLASDEDHAAAAAWGAWGEKKNYGRVFEGLIRSAFAVGSDGRIVLARYNQKATGQVGRIMRDLGIGQARETVD